METMNRIKAIAALLILCACGEEYTGLGSVDLEITSITFNDSDPATITGNLISGKPAEFILKAQCPLICSMTVECSLAADTQGMAEANSAADFPVFYKVVSGSTGGAVLFEIKHMGLSWEPAYSITRQNDQNRVFATARLTNMTVQTWNADTLRFTDQNRSSVTAATGRITVRQGSSVLPWWDAPAGNAVQVVRYGWPRPGRWNPLTAVYCPSRGRVESWPGNVWESGDTLYFAADSLLKLDLTWEQHPAEYRCFLSAESTAETTLTWQIQWPARLPRGAAIQPGPPAVQLTPMESAIIPYKEVY